VANFSERRQDEVRSIYLLVWGGAFSTIPHPPKPRHSVKLPIPEARPTPPAMPCNHLQHTDARDEALGQ
jgi:hypothetical protein